MWRSIMNKKNLVVVLAILLGCFFLVINQASESLDASNIALLNGNNNLYSLSSKKSDNGNKSNCDFDKNEKLRNAIFNGKVGVNLLTFSEIGEFYENFRDMKEKSHLFQMVNYYNSCRVNGDVKSEFCSKILVNFRRYYENLMMHAESGDAESRFYFFQYIYGIFSINSNLLSESEKIKLVKYGDEFLSFGDTYFFQQMENIYSSKMFYDQKKVEEVKQMSRYIGGIYERKKEKSNLKLEKCFSEFNSGRLVSPF